MRFMLVCCLAVILLAPAGAAPPNVARRHQIAVTEGTATTPDGVRLYFRMAGDSGPVVIAPFALYHGRSLDQLATGRRIVTYDPRGRGRSQSVSPDRVSLDLLLSDLDSVRRAVGAEQVAIIGWSGAGMEMFVYALRNPGRVTRLVQLAPVGPRIAPYGAQMMTDRQKRTDSAARSAYRKRVEAGEFLKDPVAECRARAAVSNPPLFADPANAGLAPDVCDLPNEHTAPIGAYFEALFQSIDGYDWRSDLPRVAIPRLVVHPLQDNIPLAASEEWVRGQANARLIKIHNSGHYPHYEQPEATLGAIAEFLDGRWPRAALRL